MTKKLQSLAAVGSIAGVAVPTTHAVAIDAGHAAGRFHSVSLEPTLRPDAGEANFVAVKT